MILLLYFNHNMQIIKSKTSIALMLFLFKQHYITE